MDPWIVVITVLEYIFRLIGISGQILVCSIILKYRKTAFSNPFYSLAIALAIPDTLHLCSELFCALPSTIFDLPRWYCLAWGFVAETCFWALSPLMLVIAVNRYVAVCHFDVYMRHFTPFRVRVMIAVCFLFSLLIPSIMYSCECYYDFQFAWMFTCSTMSVSTCSGFALCLNGIVANCICAGVIIVYTLIYVRYRRIRRDFDVALKLSDDERCRRNKEARLMFQFGAICGVLICYQTLFWIFLIGVWTNVPIRVVLNCFVNLNSSVSPFLYLGFGSEMRSRVPWQRRKRCKSTMQVMPPMRMA